MWQYMSYGQMGTSRSLNQTQSLVVVYGDVFTPKFLCQVVRFEKRASLA